MINILKKNSGYFAMLLAVIGFGAGPPFVTLALKEFYIIDLLAVRFFIAFLLMVIFCFLMRVEVSIKQVGLKPFLMGLLNPFLVTLSFHVGLLLTSPVNGVAIISTLPLIQPFVARIFLKEQIEMCYLSPNNHQTTYVCGLLFQMSKMKKQKIELRIFKK